MARFLIDTQVLVWLLNDEQRLGAKAAKALANPANEVAVSYFSLLEIVLKAAVGKMTYDDKVYGDIDDMHLRLLTPNRRTLANYRIFNSKNKDPFDNLLLTIASDDNYCLVTSDVAILTATRSNTETIDATK